MSIMGIPTKSKNVSEFTIKVDQLLRASDMLRRIDENPIMWENMSIEDKEAFNSMVFGVNEYFREMNLK
jgi:uncharacterized lipoprotein YehR (DUF1307 family)